MMVGDKGKKSKLTPQGEDECSEQIDGDLVLSIEKLQEVQDELEKFFSHPILCNILNEEDHKIFKYLQSLDVCDFKDVKSGYSITFNFRSNPYFENAKLTKVFTLDDEGNPNFTGTNIKWKDGMDIQNVPVHEKKGNKRPFTEESFFSWFNETQEKNILDAFHDEVADIIKEELWTNPLKYFNYEGDDESDEEDDEEDDENEENGNMKGGSGDDDDQDDNDEDDEENEEDDS
ncbi:NAP1-related protein 1-like isoform X2 [Tasmannia lanceolata]|uniref:NAP1-related protein 1-like isoform X2 n=1 Tax=Tasmannia lanceolata TaxID=3420 RepID=UPI004064B438